MSITFGAVCSLLQSVENLSIRHPRLPPKQEKESIRQIISNWFIEHRKALDDPNTNGGAVLSALFPHRRKDRVYGLQAPLLSKKLVNLLAFNRGQRALFDGWKTGTHGDLGAYLERAMRPWDGTFGSKCAFPIDRIDQLLLQLAARYRFSDAAIRKQRNSQIETDTELKNILIRLESWEAKWLVRLIMRNHSTIDLEEKYVFKEYHFLLPELLMFQNDFDAVFLMLRGELSGYPPHPELSQQYSMRLEAAQRLNAVVGVKVGRPTFYKAWSFKHCFQMVGQRPWAAEVKYDGEYCEIHVDLESLDNKIRIFSKNGKDATGDRKPLLSTIRDALRIGRDDCLFKTKCIVLGEMVIYSDIEKKILPFSKIRKHISRSGSFLGTLQDSSRHEWEHLMIVFFDILVLDNEPILRRCLQDRRKILRDLIHIVPGRSMRSEWTLVDFKTEDGVTDLKQVFARNLADRQEGLVLKSLHAPYFPLLSEYVHSQAGYFIKLKKDYLSDIGGQRDLGDFAIIGASFDAQVAPKTNITPLHWTHFHLGCCMNKDAVQRRRAKPKFKLVALLSIDGCIPKADVKYLNTQGYVCQATLSKDGSIDEYDIEQSKGLDCRMTIAFKKPFVAEILGSGFEKHPNETFEMLRHPRIQKIHHDRTWEDAVTLDDLQRMAEEKWDVPDASELDGHARDVALLVEKYVKAMRGSQDTVTTDETTQQITQQTTPRKTQDSTQSLPSDIEVQETQQRTPTTVCTSPFSEASSTRGNGIRASRSLRLTVRADTSEPPSPPPVARPAPAPHDALRPRKKRTKAAAQLSPPTPTSSKRRRILSPLVPLVQNAAPPGKQRHVAAAFAFDSQNPTLHVYATSGLKVRVHTAAAAAAAASDREDDTLDLDLDLDLDLNGMVEV